MLFRSCSSWAHGPCPQAGQGAGGLASLLGGGQAGRGKLSASVGSPLGRRPIGPRNLSEEVLGREPEAGEASSRPRVGLQVPRVLPLDSGLSNFELLILVRLDVLGEVVAAHEALAALGTGEALLARVSPQVPLQLVRAREALAAEDRKSTRLNSSH